jgi:hypothetical protein
VTKLQPIHFYLASQFSNYPGKPTRHFADNASCLPLHHQL